MISTPPCKFLAAILLVSIPTLFAGCASTERSSISKPVGELRPVALRAGQVWSGRYDPDGSRSGGTFSMLVTGISKEGQFSGLMKAGLLFKGNGKVSGTTEGSKLDFTLQGATDSNMIEDYQASYSDRIRGTYAAHSASRRAGAFELVESSISKQQFLASYQQAVKEESEALQRSKSARPKIIYSNYSQPSGPSYNPRPQQSFDDWDNQRTQQQLMERQTEALERMQREQSQNNFERTYLGR